MTLQDSVRTCLTRKYATFSGRASRSEYWWFMLAYLLAGMAVGFLGPQVQLVYVLAMICPLAAAGARRLQDTGRAGALIFLPLGLALFVAWIAPGAPASGTPGVQPVQTGWVMLTFVLMLVQLLIACVFLWWLTRPSDDGPNPYGPPPGHTPREA